MTRASDTAKLIGAGATILDGTTISTADNTDQLTLTSTDADASEGPNLVFYRNSSSPADGDDLSTIDFIGRNDNSQNVTYGQIKTVLLDASDGTEDARLEFYRMIGGVSSPDLQLNSEGVVINEGSNDIDFRVESNGNANMLFVDGGNNQVGIGTNSPTGTLTVSGGSIHLSNNGEAVVFGTGTNTNNAVFGNATSNFVAIMTAGSERTRVNADGHFYVNTSGVEPSASQVGVRVSGTQGQNFWKSANSGTSGYDHLVFFNGNGSVGSIFTNGSATTYSTSSDYRLKENVTYDFDATTRLKQLKPSRFNFKADADTTVDGFLAHEVSSIVPEAISGTKDGTEDITNVVLNADGIVLNTNVSEEDWTIGKSDGTYANNTSWVASKTVPKYQGIDQSKLVPLLVKTIQELEARITALENA